MSAEKCLAKIIPNNTALRYVEVGVLHATNLIALAEAFPLLCLIGVDSYDEYVDEAAGYVVSKSLSAHNRQIAEQRIAASGHANRIELVVQDSCEYAKNTPDHSFDVVFLDKALSSTSQKKDVLEWYSKVKPNGIFCGHDAYTPAIWDGTLSAFDELDLPYPDVVDGEVWFMRAQ